MRLKQGTELGLSQAMLCKYYKINSFICFPPYPAHASSRSSKSCYCMPLTVLVHNFCQNIPKLIAIIVFCGKGPHFCLCKPNKEIRMLKLFGLFYCLPLYKLSHIAFKYHGLFMQLFFYDLLPQRRLSHVIKLLSREICNYCRDIFQTLSSCTTILKISLQK